MSGKLLHIEDEEWQKALAYFKTHPHATKLKKNIEQGISHSFIKIPNADNQEIVYAMASSKIPKEYQYAKIGQGGEGKIKLLQDIDENCLAVKVEEAEEELDLNSEVIDILRKVNLFRGNLSRALETEQDNKVLRKIYTAMPYLSGDDLAKYCFHLQPTTDSNALNHQLVEKYLIALEACQSIQDLHDKGIIHRDIKGANFMVNLSGEGEPILVIPIDYGLSHVLKSDAKTIYTKVAGSEGYVAPEILNEAIQLNNGMAHFSRYSDIYALGNMFKTELQLDESIYQGMMQGETLQEASQRTPLKEVMQKIIHALKEPALSACLATKTKTWLQTMEDTLHKQDKRSSLTSFYQLKNPSEVSKQLNYHNQKNDLLNISDEEWHKAEEYFKQNPSETTHVTKLKRTQNNHSHSFIRLKDKNGIETIYALASRDIYEEKAHAELGKGAFGKVKIMQKRDNTVFALKVSETTEKYLQRTLREADISEDIEILKGAMQRATDKKDKKGRALTKVYMGMEYIEGMDITRAPQEKKQNQASKYLLALQAAKGIYELHQKGILHRDIKGANFMLKMDKSDQIIVLPIDFGLSLKFDTTKDEAIWEDFGGTLSYMAPEVILEANEEGKFPYTRYADIYSLGRMFDIDLSLEKEIYEGMVSGVTSDEAKERTPLLGTMSLLINKLEELHSKDNLLSQDVCQWLKALKAQIGPPLAQHDTKKNTLNP